jgi:hypothetical protein
MAGDDTKQGGGKSGGGEAKPADKDKKPNKSAMLNQVVIKAAMLNQVVIKGVLRVVIKAVMLNQVVQKPKHPAVVVNGTVVIQKKEPKFSKQNALNVILQKKMVEINKDLIYMVCLVDILVQSQVLVTAMLIKTKIFVGVVIHFGFI